MAVKAKILNASAGSGKTYQLAYNYVRELIKEPAAYRHILAVTFTNKATEEMKSRILKELHRLAANYRSSYRRMLMDDLRLSAEEIERRAVDARAKILHDYSRFTVLTIDTFFQRILRAFIKELGIDLNYNIELETASILTKSADTLIEQITTNRDLLSWLTRFVEERIEEGKSWDVKEGILSLGGELFKERNRKALLSARSREELSEIVERTTRQAEKSKAELVAAADRFMEELDKAGLSVADFPYKYSGFANWPNAISLDREPIPYGKRVLTATEEEKAWGKAGSNSAVMRPTLQPILQQMRSIYDKNLKQWNTATLLRETYRSFALLGDLYDKVQQLCNEQQLMLLSETKYLLAEFVTELDAPFIYEKVGNRFEHFMIDEFQDTSAREWENFLPLLRNALSQTERQAVLLVGDIKQSIYRWRGGDWKILHRDAAQALGTEQTEVVNLKENFRSLEEVVRFNNRIIEKVVSIDNAYLNIQLEEAVEGGTLSPQSALELRDTLQDAYRNAAQEPRRKNRHAGYVSVEEYEEEPPIIERICQLIDLGYRPSDIMILVRGATDGARVATKLLDFKRENCDPRYRFDVMTQEALVIGSAPICGFVMAVMRLALSPDESIHRALYNQYLELPFDAALDEECRQFLREIALLSPMEAFERIVLRYRLDERTQEVAYLQALHNEVITFSVKRIADLQLFITWWEEEGSLKSLSIEESQTTIEILTIHKAKGLEKRVVLIPYCNWPMNPPSNRNIIWAEANEGEAAALGEIPISYRQQMGASGFSEAYYRELVYTHVDNINLLYVALTRAVESLHVFIPEGGEKHIGSLLAAALIDGDRKTHYAFGRLEGPAPKDERRTEEPSEAARSEEPERKPRHLLQTTYPTSETEMLLSFPSERYLAANEEEALSPRNFGILMHQAFEEATDRESIYRAIQQMEQDARLSREEAEELRRQIDQALEDATVKSWFDGSWEEVRTEEVILSSGAKMLHRPDRVMIRGTEAVVVDYKFGEKDAATYRSQLRRYEKLLREMGYTTVSGYLWYVRQGKIEQVI